MYEQMQQELISNDTVLKNFGKNQEIFLVKATWL